MSKASVKVLLVDDHAIVRLGLRTLLESNSEFQVIGEAATAEEAVQCARELSPDVVLMDVRLPDRSGIEACREIRAERPSTQVLMLTSYPDEDAMLASVLAGACGYLLKELKPDALLNALHLVARGGSLLDPSLVQRVIDRFKSTDRKLPAELTEQELAVLELVARGKTNREIGEELFLSENTVKHYLSRILSKLGLARRSGAAAYWVKHQRSRAEPQQ